MDEDLAFCDRIQIMFKPPQIDPSDHIFIKSRPEAPSHCRKIRDRQARTGVAHNGSDQKLQINDTDQENVQLQKSGIKENFFFIFACLSLLRLAIGQKYCQEKERLRQHSMRYRNRRWQKEKDGDAS